MKTIEEKILEQIEINNKIIDKIKENANNLKLKKL